jgi:hypothetical protein
MTQVVIQIRGQKETIDRLKRVGAGISDFSDAFHTTGKRLTQFYSTVPFATEGGVFGRPWARLAPSTSLRKAGLGKSGGSYDGRGILDATGNMKRSFGFSSGRAFARIYNNTSYFKYHQSSAPRHKLPRRVMMMMDRERENMVRDIIKAELHKKLGSI